MKFLNWLGNIVIWIVEHIFDLFHDFSGQLSWGRVIAAVCLCVAIKREFSGGDLSHVSLWLGIATGNYGASKLTQVVAIVKDKVTGKSSVLDKSEVETDGKET